MKTLWQQGFFSHVVAKLLEGSLEELKERRRQFYKSSWDFNCPPHLLPQKGELAIPSSSSFSNEERMTVLENLAKWEEEEKEEEERWWVGVKNDIKMTRRRREGGENSQLILKCVGSFASLFTGNEKHPCLFFSRLPLLFKRCSRTRNNFHVKKQASDIQNTGAGSLVQKTKYLVLHVQNVVSSARAKKSDRTVRASIEIFPPLFAISRCIQLGGRGREGVGFWETSVSSPRGKTGIRAHSLLSPPSISLLLFLLHFNLSSPHPAPAMPPARLC